MTITARLFDGTELQFPDGTDPQVISRVAREQTALRKQQAAPQATPTPAMTPETRAANVAEMQARNRAMVDPAAMAANRGGSDAMTQQTLSDMDLRPNTYGGAIMDTLKAGAAGVARGGMELAGLPGTLGELGGRAITGGINAAFGTDLQAPQSALSGGALRGYAAGATGGATEYQGQGGMAPYAGTVGEFLPGAAALGGMGAANLLRFGVAPGVASEAAGQATEGTAYEPFARAGAALAAPMAVGAAGNLARRAISPFGGADPERLKLAKVLEDAGVPITAGQKVGNMDLIRTESRTGAGERIGMLQGEKFTEAALKTAGINANRATPDVLEDAANRIGQVFDDVTRGIDVAPDASVVTKMAGAIEEFRALAPKDTAPPVLGDIFRRVARAHRTGQTIPAADMKVWRSRVSKLTAGSDAATREAAIMLRDALDDATNAALTAAGRTDDIARLALAREEYRNFLAIERAATGASAGEGILSPALLRQAVIQQGRRAFAQGKRGDLGELARAGQDVMKPPATVLPGGVRRVEGAMMEGSILPPAVKAILPPVVANMGPQAVRALMAGPLQRYLGNQAVAPGGPILDPRMIGTIPGMIGQ